MKTQQFYTTLLIGLLASFGLAQNVAFKSQASSQQVRIGEHFKLGFYLICDSRSISVDSPIDYPNLKGFRVLDEANVRNFQVVNGDMQSSSGVELVLVAEKEGNYKIGAAKVIIDGKTYATKPIEISVSERSQTASNQNTSNQNAFLSSEVNNKNPYINEAVNLSVKLYARDYSIFNRARNFKAAKLGGLDAKVIPEEEMGERMKQEMVNGRVYISEELVRYLLFAQDAGNVKIPPFTIDIMVSGYYGAEPVTLSSNPISLKVKDLPAGKPKNFSGAVGDFKMNTSLDKKSLNANDGANLEVEIYGEGNLNNISLPNIKSNDNLEVYPPKKRENFDVSSKGFKGKIAENFVLVPQYGGQYNLDPIEFSYFNPKTEKYVTLKSPALELDVKGDAAPEKADTTSGTSKVNDYLANSGKETNVIPEIAQKLPENVKESLSDHTIYWVLGLLALFGVGIVFLIKKKKQNTTDISKDEVIAYQAKKVEPKKINKLDFKVDLDELKTLVHESSFYPKQEQLLIKIGQNLSNLDLANFNDQSVLIAMKEANISDDFITDWQRLLANARQAKYGAVNKDSDNLLALSDTQKLLKRYQDIF